MQVGGLTDPSPFCWGFAPIPHLALLHLLSSLSLRTKATRQSMLRDLVSGVGFMV